MSHRDYRVSGLSACTPRCPQKQLCEIGSDLFWSQVLRGASHSFAGTQAPGLPWPSIPLTLRSFTHVDSSLASHAPPGRSPRAFALDSLSASLSPISEVSFLPSLRFPLTATPTEDPWIHSRCWGCGPVGRALPSMQEIPGLSPAEA